MPPTKDTARSSGGPNPNNIARIAARNAQRAKLRARIDMLQELLGEAQQKLEEVGVDDEL